MIRKEKRMYREKITQLKARRFFMNMTLERLADLVGVSDKMIGKWEREEAVPNIQNFEAWCNALDIHINLSAVMSDISSWCPSQEFIDEIKKQFKGVNYEYESENFRDWYKSKGELSADWDALFRMWVRRSFKFHRTTTTNDAKNTEIVSSTLKRLYANKDLPN
jgi:transcriptional regulator with XRE-family HTH domain